MGICSSCLGLDRHPSQDETETDPLLIETQPQRYGTLHADDIAHQQGEEELQRERETLRQITVLATDNMIDVLHPETVEVTHHLTSDNTHTKPSQGSHERHQTEPSSEADIDEAEEQAWLDSIHNSQNAPVTQIKSLKRGALVMDLGELREQIPALARRPVRSAFGSQRELSLG